MNWGKEIGREPDENVLKWDRYAKGPGFYFVFYDKVTYEEMVDGVQRTWTCLEQAGVLHTHNIPPGEDLWLRHASLKALGELLDVPRQIADRMPPEKLRG